MTRRLGRNRGAYHGEIIDLPAVLRETTQDALRRGWQIETLPAAAGLDLITLHRPALLTQEWGARLPDRPAKAGLPGAEVRRVYLSTGIHGDEPAGPLAAGRLIRENAWPDDVELWFCPCLNPTGFPLNRRENARGFDLNRDYRDPQTDEVRAHITWLQRQPDFDLTLCLHEDWEAHGFYVYEVNPDGQPSRGPAMVQAVAPVCPIDHSPSIDGREAIAGIIRPNLDLARRPQWPEALYLVQHKTRHSYTLEAPSDFALEVRVAALVAAVRSALARA